ncbi:MAG: Gfo/Idh/MocA family oxidoreductase [Planctomycetota bacterium]|nr:Gfo/Idh/MocA family oxidoreductase [Planctomycetota bacterium]
MPCQAPQVVEIGNRMKLKVGLVGIGDQWESRHRPALKSLSDRFQVMGVCSDISIKAHRVAQDFEAIQFDGFRSLIQRNDLDAVLCLSENWGGPLPMLAACDYRKAIYSSSALDMDPSRASHVKKRVENSGVAFMAEFAKRHTPATIRLKELIATRLGQPRLIFCTERLTRQPTLADPLNKSDSKLLVELIDWCNYIIGMPPAGVQGIRHCFPNRRSGEKENREESPSSFLNLSLDYGTSAGPNQNPGPPTALAQIRLARLLPKAWKDAIGFRRPASLQVTCEKGVAYIDSPTTITWFDDAGQHTESLEADRPVGEQLLTLFHRAVTSLVRKTSDLEDAYQARIIVDSAEDSFASRQRIEL